MSSVPEIEAAIEKLPPAELRELITWIEDYTAAIGGSETLFAMYDAEEEQTRTQDGHRFRSRPAGNRRVARRTRLCPGLRGTRAHTLHPVAAHRGSAPSRRAGAVFG